VGGWRACFTCFVLSDAEGPGIVNQRWTEAADRVARYQADQQGELGCATRTINCCRYMEDVLCFGLPVIFPWFLVLLCLRRVVVFFFFYLFFQLVVFKCLPHPLRGGTTVCFLHIFLFSFSLSICLLFFFFVSFLYFMECVCRARRIQHDDRALHCPLLLCLLHTWQRSISVA